MSGRRFDLRHSDEGALYPPNETRSGFLRHVTTACAAPGVNVMSIRAHQAYRADS